MTRLFHAWQTGYQPAAVAVATPEAVAEMFHVAVDPNINWAAGPSQLGGDISHAGYSWKSTSGAAFAFDLTNHAAGTDPPGNAWEITHVAFTPTYTGVCATPEGCAQSLFAAWQADDQAAAHATGPASVVDPLFTASVLTHRGEPWQLGGCSGAAGSTVCRYIIPERDPQITITVPTEGSGPAPPPPPYSVSQVSFPDSMNWTPS